MRHEAFPIAIITAIGLTGSILATVILRDNVLHAISTVIAETVVMLASLV